MSSDTIPEKAVLEDIRREIKKIGGDELSDEEILRYMKNPEEYQPSVAVIEKFIEGQVHLSEMFKNTEVDCSVKHAVSVLRFPFFKAQRAYQPR